jgi:hypothetical protein
METPWQFVAIGTCACASVRYVLSLFCCEDEGIVCKLVFIVMAN